VVLREIATISPPGRGTLALARPLVGRPGLAVLASDGRGALSPDDARFTFVACDPVETSEAWVPPPGAFARGWAGFPAAPRWIGAIPYEAARDLERPAWRGVDRREAPPWTRPRWHRYDAVLRVDRVTGRLSVEADDDRAADRLVRALAAPAVLARAVSLRPRGEVEPAEAHVARVREALRLIAQGDVYQVNLARCLSFRASGAPFDLFEALFKGAPSPYGFFADWGDVVVCGTSPELALEARGDRLRTAPIKGTRPRGADAAVDALHAQALDADTKERAELTMAVDLHRNDLGRVSLPGSVRLLGAPRVVGSRTVWSRVAEVVARRAPGLSLEDVARAMLPSGSVTGAPKVRAMEIIADLEPFRRGLYTGAYGYVGRDGALCMAMAIRTLEIGVGGAARYCTGGGIVADSDPWCEFEETRWKAAQLASLARSVTKLGRIGPRGVALGE
jgi:anthranilate/para-aminobenzoate synthase component I